MSDMDWPRTPSVVFFVFSERCVPRRPGAAPAPAGRDVDQCVRFTGIIPVFGRFLINFGLVWYA